MLGVCAWNEGLAKVLGGEVLTAGSNSHECQEGRQSSAERLRCTQSALVLCVCSPEFYRGPVPRDPSAQ